MRLNLFDLQLFAAVAEAGNLTQAAKRVHLATAAASARIKNLEASLGVLLFDREPTGLRLTPAGETALHHARRLLAGSDRLRDDLSGFGRGLKGLVRIASISIGATEHLPRVLSAFLREHPDVNVEIAELVSEDVIRAVRELAADIGIIAGALDTHELQVFPYVDERLVVLAPVDHPLARRKRVSFEEAIDHDFVGFNEASTLNPFLLRRSADIGKSFRKRALLRGPYEVSRMVEAGVGVSIMEESAARRYAATARVKMIPLSDAWALREMKVCVRDAAALPPFTRELFGHLGRAEGGRR
ncbi:MAG: LysR family transcriptional regulator [Bacteroidota bacterium]